MLTKAEIERYRKILEAKKLELEKLLRNREDIAIEKSPDALDEVQRAAERELAIRNLDRETGILRQVKGALRRIKEGTYGVCMISGEQIDKKRLDAVPWTPFTLTVQEALDRREKEAVESLEELMIDAA